MDLNTFPTKGNLMLAKNSLALARQGYQVRFVPDSSLSRGSFRLEIK